MRSSAALLPALVLALPAFAGHNSPSFGRRHAHGDAARRAETPAKRAQFDDARFSFYDITTGEVACGGFYHPGDHVVALNAQQFNGGSHCGDSISISFNGKSTSATIVDECMGCGYGGLDLTEGLFSFFASESIGIIHGAWGFGGGGGDSSPPPPPPPPPKPKPKPAEHTPPPPPPPPPTSTKAKETPKATSSAPPDDPKTSSAPASTSKPASTSSSAAPAATLQPAIDYGVKLGLASVVPGASVSGTQNLLQMTDLLVGLGAMVLSG